MDIKRLLEYASIDAEMAKLNMAFNEEAEVKEYKLQSKRYKDSSDLIAKLNAEAEDVIKQIGALQERYLAANKELEEYRTTAEDIEDENEADFYSKNVEKLIATLSALSNEVASLGKRIADIRTQTNKAFAVAQDATKRLGDIRNPYAEVTKKYAPQVNEIKARLTKAAEGLGDALVVYQNLKKAGVKNRITTINGTNCGGCFMDIDANTLNRIDSYGYVLCPNCGRILYK